MDIQPYILYPFKPIESILSDINLLLTGDLYTPIDNLDIENLRSLPYSQKPKSYHTVVDYYEDPQEYISGSRFDTPYLIYSEGYNIIELILNEEW
jgi:hypothetical protein